MQIAIQITTVLRNPNTGEILCLAPNLLDNNIAADQPWYSPTPRKPDIFGDDLRTLQTRQMQPGFMRPGTRCL